MLNELANNIHATAVEKGWWEKDIMTRNFGEVLALIHSEVSEVLEAYRDGHNGLSFVDGKPEGVPSEMADIIIRVLDACAAYGIDIEEAMKAKMDYNKTRPYRHGGKVA